LPFSGPLHSPCHPDVRAPVLVVLLAGVLFSTVFPAPAGAAVNPVPVLAVKLDSANQYARVTESAPGIVTFTGQASIDKLPMESCVVYLNSSTDTGWASQVSPLRTTFTNTTPQSFTCTVLVPPGTANSEYGNLFIRGRAVAEGMQSIAETRGIIAVEPFFRCKLTSTPPCQEIAPGEQAFFTICVTNTGNAIDSFELEIANLRDLSEKRWTVVLCAGTLPKVAPAEYKPFRVTAQSPRDETFWTSEPTIIVIKTTSQNAKDFQQVVSATCQLTVHVRGTYLPSLDPVVLLMVLAFAAAYLAVRPERMPGGRRRRDTPVTRPGRQTD